MKLKSIQERKEDSMPTMKTGQVGLVVNSSSPYKDHIILKVYDGFISLTEPKHTWRRDEGVSQVPFGLEIRILPKGTLITFEVEE